MAGELSVLLCVCGVYTNTPVLCMYKGEEAEHAWVDAWYWYMASM